MFTSTSRSVLAALTLCLGVTLSGCGGDSAATNTPSSPPVRKDFAFGASDTPWTPAYSDYAIGMDHAVEFATGVEALPSPLSPVVALRMRSHNRPGDVFMYASRKLDGFTPHQRYKVRMSVRFATNAPQGCAGDSVVVKAGALSTAPVRHVVGSSVRTVFDKGDQGNAGTQSLVLGNIAGASGPCGQAAYAPKSLDSAASTVTVQANAQGEVWVYFGTESAFQGVTDIYLIDGFAVFTKA